MPTPARQTQLDALRAHVARLGRGIPELAFPARQVLGAMRPPPPLP